MLFENNKYSSVTFLEEYRNSKGFTLHNKKIF